MKIYSWLSAFSQREVYVLGLGRFFGIPKNTDFFEEPVFPFCQTLNTEKPEKDEKSENPHKNGEPAHYRE